ncbi:MAG: prolyl 4-hydroxylase subunit alpha [Acidobacteria bacterium]|nr:MAG: prolyl 4-hydroxylase subunit alpha [Acidobacteriota bacterium]
MISSVIQSLSWPEIRSSLWNSGYARMGRILVRAQCEELRSLYSDASLFRSRIDMERYRFGRGEYQYFANPLPAIVAELREKLYRFLAQAANEWMSALRIKADFPADLASFLRQCHRRGQKRPTPLLLRYKQGDYNCLHQDVYGDVVFPLQVIFALSKPDDEFTGGELLLVEQRPRAQSIGHVIRMEQGEAVVITTRYRPVKGSRGYYRTNFRHGVSEVLSGERYTLGIVFHDAA